MPALTGSFSRIRHAVRDKTARHERAGSALGELAQGTSEPLSWAAYAALDSRALVTRLRASDPQAASELWHRYVRRVRALLRRIIGADAEIDDVLQEVFVQVFRSIHRLRDDDKLTSYVLGVAANTARAELRRRVRQRRRERSEPRELWAAPHDHSGRQALRRLERILDDLSPELRVAFVLRHVEGLELKEVAGAMSWSLATTKRRLRKAQGVVYARASQDELLREFVDDGGHT